MAVGLSDAVRLCHVLHAALRPYAELRIRRCPSLAFSPSGHLLLAADGTTAALLSNISFKKLFSLKGHNAKVGMMNG